MRKKEKISPTEEALFREAMRHVKPLTHTKITKSPSPLAPKTKPRQEIETSVSQDSFSDYEKLPLVSSEDNLYFSQTGIQHKILRNLRNGKYNIEASLDLHGKTVEEARHLLIQFLFTCKQNSIRHVLIIHGKGRSHAKPILKNKLNHWLRQTEQVLAFSSATIKDGRSGALYVLLKGS